MEKMAISKFKVECLAVLERVRRTGQPVLITRFGRPVAEIVAPTPGAAAGDWIGSMRDTGRILGDLVAPALEPEDWEVLGR